MNERDQNTPDEAPVEWTSSEARALRALGEVELPDTETLRAKTFGGLRDMGLLGAPRRRRWILAAAAALVIGFALGRATIAPVSDATSGRPRYVLLLSGGGATTARENEARREEYGAWFQTLERRGVGVEGYELVAPRHELPAGKAPQPVVGYFVIDAASEEEALRLAATNPHLRYGGGVTLAALR